jgi:hypothetical protein
MAKKDTTNEDLRKLIEDGFDQSARMTQKGFDEVGKRFNKVDGELQKIRVRMIRIEAALFGDYKKRLEKLEEDFEQSRRFGA